jgi:hypothetical protein
LHTNKWELRHSNSRTLKFEYDLVPIFLFFGFCKVCVLILDSTNNETLFRLFRNWICFLFLCIVCDWPIFFFLFNRLFLDWWHWTKCRHIWTRIQINLGSWREKRRQSSTSWNLCLFSYNSNLQLLYISPNLGAEFIVILKYYFMWMIDFNNLKWSLDQWM